MTAKPLTRFPHSRLPPPEKKGEAPKKELMWSEAGRTHINLDVARQKILDTVRKFKWLTLIQQQTISNSVGSALMKIISGADFTVLAVAHKPFMLGVTNYILLGVMGMGGGGAREIMECWILDQDQVCVLYRIE